MEKIKNFKENIIGFDDIKKFKETLTQEIN